MKTNLFILFALAWNTSIFGQSAAIENQGKPIGTWNVNCTQENLDQTNVRQCNICTKLPGKEGELMTKDVVFKIEDSIVKLSGGEGVPNATFHYMWEEQSRTLTFEYMGEHYRFTILKVINDSSRLILRDDAGYVLLLTKSTKTSK